jgi:hypothetical protein
MPKIETINGVRMIPAITARLTKKLRKVKIELRNSLVFSRPSVKRYSLKVGMNAAAMEPSAKRRRKRLGIIKATENESDSALVPRRRALTISRAKPRIRDAKVRRDSIDPRRTRESTEDAGLNLLIQKQ